MKQTMWLIILLTALGVVIVGCAGPIQIAPVLTPEVIKIEAKTEAPPAEAEEVMMKAPEPNPKRGGILKTAWGMSPTHFDIHQGGGCAGCNMMYDGLIMWNVADGYRTVIPALAKTWAISDDQTVYTFTLRDGVSFHDGTPFSAEDVVATFDRIINPPDNIAIGGIREQLEMLEKVEAK